MNERSHILIDLSHDVSHGMVTYPGLPPPRISDYLSREDSRKLYSSGTEFHIGKIEMVANTGTYIDAPSHRFQDGSDLAGLALEKVANLEGVVIRAEAVSKRVIDLSRIDPKLIKDKAVLVYSGWSRYWNSERYFGEYPFLTKRSAEFLRDAGAVLVGIDSVNIDDNRDGTRPVHTILLEAGIPIVEHMTNLESLPESGFRFFATPVKMRDFGSFPVRAFAMLSTSSE